jgi:two-component system, sensor histidine kinase and response regulator
MRKCLLLLAALLWYAAAPAQQARQLDSLLKVLDTHTQDSNRMHTLRRIGGYYIDNNPTKAIGYYEQVVELAKKLNDRLRLANAQYDLGFCYLLKSNYDQSLYHYQQSEKIYTELNDQRRLVNALISIGNVFFQHRDFIKTNEYYNHAEVIVRQTKDTVQLSNLYGQRGMIYDQLKQYDTSLRYLYKSLELARLSGNPILVARNLINVGLTWKHKNNTAMALRYFDTAMQLYRQLPDVPVDNIAATYNNIAATQSQAGNYAAAEAAFAKSIECAKQAGIPAIEMENCRNMADMYGNRKDYRRQSLYLTRYYSMKDSIFGADSKNQLTQLEADYQLEKKNNSLVRQAAETNRQKSQRNLFVIIAAGALVLLAALAFFYRRIRQKNSLLEDRNRQIDQQKSELQALNHVKDRLFSVISHDLRNPLATLKGYLSLASDESLPPQQKETYRQKTVLAVSQTSHLLDNLLSWANMQLKAGKPAITPIHLPDCVADAWGAVAAQATQKNIQLHQQMGVDTALGNHPTLEMALRNLFTNAVKFSHTGGSITVFSEKQADRVALTVEDEGVGMDPAQLAALQGNDMESTAGTAGEKGSGLGLLLTKELLLQTAATLHISSQQGSGTRCTILLPA